MSTIPLRQNTAIVVPIGEWIDDTNGADLEEALTVANIDFQLIQPLDSTAIPPERVTNGALTTDTGWTKGTGWDINSTTANKAHHSTGTASVLSQVPALAFVEGRAYELIYTISGYVSGSLNSVIASQVGATNGSDATFTETIVALNGVTLAFSCTSDFVGDIDDVSVKQVPVPITAAASGSSNDMVLCRANTANYWLELTAAQVSQIGYNKLTGFISGALIVSQDFQIYDAAVYDALYGTGGTFIDIFDIGVVYEALVTDVNSATSHDYDVSIITDDNWIGLTLTYYDDGTGDTWVTWVADVDQANDRIIAAVAPGWTVAVGDKIRVRDTVHPTYALNTYDPPTRTELTTDTNALLAVLADLVPVQTTIATLASQVSFTLTAGSINDNAYNGWIAIITDQAAAVQKAIGIVKDYAGGTQTVTLSADPGTFTMAATDKIALLPPAAVMAWNGAQITGDGSSGDKIRTVNA